MDKSVAGRFAAVSAAVLGAALVSTPASAQKIENSYICVFKEGAVAKGAVSRKANEVARANGGTVNFVYSNTIRGFSANMPAHAAANVAARNPNIAFCEQDQVMATVQRGGKPPKGGSGGGSGPAQVVPWGIARVGGGTQAASGLAIVIDSGVDYTHPDLNVDVSLSRSFTREKDGDDANGHGTHVAGTMAAIDNDIGVVGVAPGTTVVAVKVLTRSGSGSNSGVIAGVDYAASLPGNGNVANMSLGGGFSQALNDAVKAAALTGLKMVLAAGNESTDANTKSPASAEGPGIYTISAMAEGDTWASFSNYGNPPIDFAEPGVAVYSTYKDGGYATLSGTSMAAPHAAGLLLLGAIRGDGTVSGDPDGRADTIGVR